MPSVFETTYSILLFVAIYFQVFFLYVFFEKKEEFAKEITDIDDSDLISVTFLIPCFNEELTVVKTIESVLSLDYPKHLLKIIAIDDGSSDNTWQKLSQFKDNPSIKLIKQENGGKFSALNNALNYVTTELVVSFDADTEIKKDALKEAVKRFVIDPKLMALGGTVLIASPKTLVQRAQSVEYQIFSFTKKILGLIGGVLVVPGAFSVFRKEVFTEIGGYREAHNLEDVELTFRMQKQGFKIDHCENAFVTTKGPDTLKKLFKQRLRWCYGFIQNFKEYSHMLFNKNFKNFGFFTLPLNTFAYVMIIFVFGVGLYRLSYFLYEQILELVLVGFQGFSFFNMDLFFIDTKITTLLGICMFIFLLIGVIMGKKTSKTSTGLFSFICFIVLYSILAPLWVLKSFYNSLLSIKTSWR